IHKQIPDFESTTVLCLVKAGSRYESEEQRGLAHFLEHMFFKGGEKYQNAKEVATAIDAIGGDFNAFTGKEYAGYYVKCANEHLDTASDVLSDMLVRGQFKDSEIEKERGVIIEELNMYQDTPMYQVGWNFENLVIGDQSLGWDTIGVRETIMNFQHKDFVQYYQDLYQSSAIVIAICGGIDFEKAKNLVSNYFSDLNNKTPRNFPVLKDLKAQDPIHIQEKKTEQAHFVLGGKSPAARQDDSYAAKLLGVICGGMMSSRMFLNIREARGLCYYISTSTDEFKDTGLISTSAGVDLNRLLEAVEAVLAEYRKLRNELVNEDELNKAKNFLLGKMKLRLEDSEDLAHFLGRQELLHDEILSPEEIAQKIKAISAEDIQSMAQKVFAPENLHLAIIGPFAEQKPTIQELLAQA
ncbi:MAG TPA: pitrilysin family protein, partial [Candidatus Gracilibacteria bacterium]|nr:pitrilysin family protein [Candidatus Gracilibacteria bacterium]